MPEMDSPARLTIASTPASAPGSRAPAAGSQRDLVRPLRGPAHELDHPVAGGREVVGQVRADETAGAADGDRESRLRAPEGMPFEVGGQARVAKAEHARERLAGLRATHRVAERAGRQLELDVVDELAAELLGRHEAVRVIPASERPFDLAVRELPPGDVAVVLGDPASPHRSQLDLEHQAGAVFDAGPGAFEHADLVPGRRHPRERPRTKVPVVDLFGWHRHETPLLEDRHGDPPSALTARVLPGPARCRGRVSQHEA